jgi:hypothetical protein
MDAKPRRRWLRFRLSTILVLMAIAAWTMAVDLRLDVEHRVEAYSPPSPPRSGKYKNSWETRFTIWSFNGSTIQNESWRIDVNPAIKWPALALAAFLAWKGARAFVARRRRVQVE